MKQEEEEEEDAAEAEAEAEAEADMGADAQETEHPEVIDQIEIDRNWIKNLGMNYPLKTYYKHLKRAIQIILGSERIPTRQYPKWSENLYRTFLKLNDCVP